MPSRANAISSGRTSPPLAAGSGHIGVRGCSEAHGNCGRAPAAGADGDRADRAWPGEGVAMSERESFERILASLHEAVLDRAHWLTASALIDEALGTHGSSLTFGDGSSGEEIRIYFLWQFFRGQRHRELEREYSEVYYPVDERPPPHTPCPRRPAVAHNRPLYRGGTENLRDIQRGVGPHPRPERHPCAPGRDGRLAHRVGCQRPGRRGRLAGAGLPVSPERGERREPSSCSPAALVCSGPDVGVAGRGLSGVSRRPRLSAMRRTDGDREVECGRTSKGLRRGGRWRTAWASGSHRSLPLSGPARTASPATASPQGSLPDTQFAGYAQFLG